MRPDYLEVRIFWISSRKDNEEVSQLLEANTGSIRKGMYTVSGLGKIPKLVFVLDLNYLHMQQMEDLFREGFNKKNKKIWIYPYLGGWVSHDGDNIHKKTKKNMPLKSILDHSKSF